MNLYHKTDHFLTHWLAQRGIVFLRLSIGFIFIWFGGLKFFPGASPAEELALSAISVLTFDLIPESPALFLLAGFEVLIGAGLIFGRYMRIILLMLIIQMIGTMSPVLLFPEIVFNSPPFLLTIEGQYILKNVIVISSAMVIGATVRGGGLTASSDSEPDLSEQDSD
ncbi:MAG: DoxX family membrane protein [Balneolaceae bacterium]|nr:MAG: DoxX family membrane protein [Balneolaceae bacterium]